MRKIYLDSDYICHLIDDGTRRMYYTDLFDESTPEKFIEGYRVVPTGETWISPEGGKFRGLMAVPIVNYTWLENIKEQHEIDDDKYTQELGALIDEIYNEDLEVIG